MKKLNVFVIAGLLFSVGTVYAQFPSVVYDPVHTAKTIINTQHMIKAEITRLQQLKIQLEQMANFKDSALNTWKGNSLREHQALLSYIQGLKNVYGDVNAQSGRLRARLDQAKLAKMSWEEYQKKEEISVKQGEEEAVRRHNDDIRVLQKTEEDYKDVKQWESMVNSNITQKQSSQVMNQQLNKLIAQNAQLLKSMVASRVEARDDVGVSEEKLNQAIALTKGRIEKEQEAYRAAIAKERQRLPKSPLQGN